MDEVTLRQLRYCLALSEQLHFGRAAESAGIAQPPLSVQIRQLERRLGVELFRRSARKVELTAAGTAYAARAREILAAVDAAAEEVRMIAAGESGRLRVAYPSSLLYTGLSSIVARFRNDRPRVTIDLIESPSARHAELLRSGAANAVFARDAENEMGITRHRLLREKLVVALPSGHALARSSAIRPIDLADEPFVFFPRDAHPVLHDRIVTVLHSAGVTARTIQESNEWLTVVALVQAGLGLSIVPESFQTIRSAHVCYRPLRTRATSEVTLCVATQGTAPLVSEFVRLALHEASALRARQRRSS